MLMLKTGALRIDTVSLYKSHTTVDVLRLDLLHPVVSGNKFFKLEKYIEEAQQLGKSTLLTFGGPYSNHIVATAAAAQLCGMASIGIVRCHPPKQISPTLADARDYGMQVFFAPTADAEQQVLSSLHTGPVYSIPMGGYGLPGKEGAKAILGLHPIANYSHIITAVGTGTTLAGLIESSLSTQQVLGISAMKNNTALEAEVQQLLPAPLKHRVQILHDYHCGGFARHTPELLNFMNAWYQDTGIPSDFVYTGKLFFALHDLVSKKFFPEGSSVLVIHSGGLQGNRSLAKGTLIFGL